MTETGGEARRRARQLNDRKKGKWIILDQKGEKNLHEVEIGSNVGEVNPSNKCVDGAGPRDDTITLDQ